MEISNYLNLRELIPNNINLLAVSKGVESSRIKIINELGQNDFGESKFQEAYEKKILLCEIKKLKWHFIGKLQSNKIRKIVNHFDYIHSVDSIKNLLRISNAATELGKTPKIMIQVKLENDPSKGGMETDELLSKWEEIKEIQHILIVGLMTINPKGLSSKENLKLFIKCRELADSLGISECSMGMSNDWKEAIEAGTTWLRMGSLIFGER